MAKSNAVQIVVYDVANNPLPDRLIRQLEESVTAIIKGQTTVAHTVVKG